MPVLASISLTNDDISDKLAADARFNQLIKLDLLIEKKIRLFSVEDKNMFVKLSKEKNISMILNLYAKCGIDYKNYAFERTSIVNELNVVYELDKRTDKVAIINSALLKLKTPFADCMWFFSADSALCAEIYLSNPYFDFDGCLFGAFMAWVGCILVLE